MKATLVIGASDHPYRYAYRAVVQLNAYGHRVYAFGIDSGKIENTEIETQWNPEWEVDTVTLYINPTHQPEYYDKIVALKPKRVIFNPGTENSEFVKILMENNIEHEFGCTLVMLSIGEY